MSCVERNATRRAFNGSSDRNERKPSILVPEVVNASTLRDAITEILESEVVEAIKIGEREESVSRLTSLLYEYQDRFRVKFPVSPLVKVPIFKV